MRIYLCSHVFSYRRTDAGILRRVRIIQRSNTSGSIGTRHVVAPQEIVTLKKGQLTTATLGMNFQSASDRDGALQARFDFKSDRGSNPVDIRPSLGELLRPCHMSQKDFESKITALQGFQRVVSSFQLPADSISTAHAALPQSIMKHAALVSTRVEDLFCGRSVPNLFILLCRLQWVKRWLGRTISFDSRESYQQVQTRFMWR